MRGELVGINTAIASRSGGYQGIGFAIPSNMAQSIMEQLIVDGKIVRGYLGVYMQPVDNDLADAMDLSSKDGVLVSSVIENSPAYKAGVQKGDVIIRVNGKEIDSPDHLKNMIGMLGADEKVTVTILRDGKEKNIAVTLIERTEDVRLASVTREKAGTFDGLSVAPLDNTTRERYRIPEEVDNGVVVTNVGVGSAASTAKLQQGDVFREI